MNFSGVFLQKCISSPKYRFRECRWRGCHKMPDQSKPPLKVDQTCSNFHRKLILYQRMNLYWSGPLEGHIRNFHFYCVNTSYPMDNSLSGRCGPACQTSEKDVLCLHRPGQPSTVHSPDGVSYFLPV